MRPRKSKGKKLTKSEQMARVRSKDTSPEMLLRQALWEKGFRYRLQPSLPGTPDIAFMGRRVAVFVDGCFWHGCPLHYSRPVENAEFWEKKLLRNTSRDRRVDAELESLGWFVIRIWEHEIFNDMESVIHRMQIILHDACEVKRKQADKN